MNATILKFPEKFDHPFSNVFIFGVMFPESHGFVAARPVTRWNNFVSVDNLDRDKVDHVSLIQFVAGIPAKPCLSGNMLPNIKTCNDG